MGLWGIRVVGIAPGFCNTDSTNTVMENNLLNDIKRNIPLRRLGYPEEIASGVIFAAKNDFLNGKILEIDGGLVI